MSTSPMVFKVLSRTFLIAILSFTCGLLADTATVDGYTWTYHVVDGQAEIGTTQYCAAISPEPTGPVTIPSSLDGYPVTSIGLAAFNCCSGLTKVTIPNGVTTIGEYAFTGCKNLENVFIPGSVTNIGFRAFNGARLTNITVDTANRVYSSRNGLLLNKEGTVLIYGVYGGEDGVVEIPFGVTCIEDSAFVGCGDLTRVMIPSSVTNIGYEAFHDSYENLTNIMVDAANTAYSSRNGLLLNKEGTVLLHGVNGDVEIPFGVTQINDSAFRGRENLRKIMIPDSVTDIGDSAFANCIGLTEVTIPANVTNIGQDAFFSCWGLTNIVIPACVLEKGFGAMFQGGFRDRCKVTILDGVGKVDDYAFSGWSEVLNLTSVMIPNSVTNIGACAFLDCSGLTKMIIPTSVVSIGESAFRDCWGLTGVVGLENVKEIGREAFSGCSGLTNVTIPNSVTNIGSGAFSRCNGLTNVRLPKRFDGNLDSSVFKGCGVDLVVDYYEESESGDIVSPPSIAVVLDPTGGVVSSSTNNDLSVAALDVELSEPWSQDVTVRLTPMMRSGSGMDPFSYIGMSTVPSGAANYDDENMSLTVRAGETRASATGSMLYVYANRANDDTVEGIRFMPTIDPVSANAVAAEAFFTGTKTAATLQINGNAPVITVPEEGRAYFNIPVNTPTDFTITVADAMWQLHGTYTVYIDYYGSGSYEKIENLTANASGELTFPCRYDGAGETFNSFIYVENQDGWKSAPRMFVAHVNAPKKVMAMADRPQKTYCEGEVAELSFVFSEPFNGTRGGYVFLEPVDEQARELVVCDAFDYGIPISIYSTKPMENVCLVLKDGWEGCTLTYNVVVRSTNDPKDDTNILSTWGSEGITLNVTNAVPSVFSISMNGTHEYTSGETVMALTAVGVQNMFEIDAFDASEVDLDDDAFETVFKFYENDSLVRTVTLYGNPYGEQIPYAFSTGGLGIRNKVTVQVYDKDMSPAERRAADENPFTVFVETLDAPAVNVAPYNNRTLFKETETGRTLGRIDVAFTVPPVGLGTGYLTVHLDVERVGTDDGNYTLPVLSATDLQFRNGVTQQSVFFTALDGTPQGANEGFRLRARVTTDTPSPDTTKTWAEYYREGTFTFMVANVAPEIGSDETTKNEIPATIGEPCSLVWTVDDIESDKKSMKVCWEYEGNFDQSTMDVSGRALTKEITFTTTGPKTVRLTVSDKDGGTCVRDYCFYVHPVSEMVEIGDGRTVTVPGDWLGKKTVRTAADVAANGRKVWECYLLGLDPERVDDDFHIASFELKDGKPVFTFSHTEDGSGASFIPRIRTLGKARLEDTDWTVVPTGSESAFRFFKAEVALP